MNKKEQLIKQTYGKLQSTEEFKHYLQEFVYNQSKNMTTEVDYMLKKSYEDSESPLSYDDLDLITWNIETAKEDIKNEIEELTQEELKELDKTKEELLNILENLYKIEELEEFTTDNLISFDKYNYEENAEVYQWFIMDDRLIYQLEQRGEIILNDCYWGRQSFGQAIEMDGVIIEIFKEWYLNLKWIEDKFNLLEKIKNE